MKFLHELLNFFNCHANIIGAITGILALFISTTQMIYSRKANKKADEANRLAEDANNKADTANRLAEDANKIAERAYFPCIKFTGKFNITQKSILQLRCEKTFVFDNTISEMHDAYSDTYLEDSDILPCITVEIMNCGKQLISGIKIKKLWIKEGASSHMCDELSDTYKTLCDITESDCTQNFILHENDRTTINLCIIDAIRDRYDIEDEIECVNECMKTFFEQCDCFFISMNLEIESSNNTRYQGELTGTYDHNKKIVSYSLSNLIQI